MALSGMPSTGHSLLLQQADGDFDLAVWNEPDVWNQNADQPILVEAQSVTLDLGATHSSIEVFDPLVGTAPIATFSNTDQVTFDVADHLVIVRVDADVTSGGGDIGGEPADGPGTRAVLTFDDLALASGTEQPLTRYGGFDFAQTGVYHPDGALGYATASGDNLLFFAEAGGSDIPGYETPAGSDMVITRTDGGAFAFHGASFSAAHYELTVYAKAYDAAGNLIASNSLPATSGEAVYWAFEDEADKAAFADIHSLHLWASGYFGIDDFAYTTVA